MGWHVARSSTLALSLLGSAAWFGGAAEAQQAFTRIQAFGDSYVDTGNALALLKQFAPAAYAQLAPIYPTGRFSGGTNYVDTISSLLNIPQQNYAIGGAEATTANTIAGLPGFTQEWQGFVASGGRIAPSDLVLLNIGGNDARVYYQGGGSPAGAPAAATVSATAAITGINALVSAGARTIVYSGGDVSGLPEAAAFPSSAVAVGSVFSNIYNQQVEAALGGLARSGTRAEYIDLTLLENQIIARPGVYGFTNTGACSVACIGNPALQNQYLYYVDGIHLTSHGFAVLGEYEVNRLEAPGTFPAQGDVGRITEIAFAQTLFGRMDLFGGAARAPLRELADLPARAPLAVAPPPVNPLSVVLLVDGGAGDGTRSSAGTGYTFTSIGGTVAAEYRFNDAFLFGAAFNYSNPDLKLSDNQARTQADSYQFGVYGTWTTPTVFVQGLATGGVQTYHNTRAGVVDTVGSDPNGNTFVVGGKIGRLFDVEAGGLRVGPIAGLLYGRAHVNDFTEHGDPVLTLRVGSQTEDTLIASGGAQIRAPAFYQGIALDAFANFTVESDVTGDGRIIQYGATSAPLIVNSLAVPSGDSRRPYGRVAAGFSAPVTPTVSVTAFATTTIDRPGGNDFSGNGGIKFAF